MCCLVSFSFPFPALFLAGGCRASDLSSTFETELAPSDHVRACSRIAHSPLCPETPVGAARWLAPASSWCGFSSVRPCLSHCLWLTHFGGLAPRSVCPCSVGLALARLACEPVPFRYCDIGLSNCWWIECLVSINEFLHCILFHGHVTLHGAVFPLC